VPNAESVLGTVLKLLAQVPEFIVMAGEPEPESCDSSSAYSFRCASGPSLGDEDMKFCEINTSEARTRGFGGLAPHNDQLVTL